MSHELSAFQKKRKRQTLARTLLVGILVAVLLGVGTYFALTKYFVVEEVLIQQTDLYSTEELRSAFSIETGTPLYQVSKKEISSAIEEDFRYLVDVSVSFDLPNQVVVSFTEDFGEFSVNLGIELFAVDRDLNVLAKEDGTSGIPRIELISSDVSTCFVGQKLCFFDDETGKILEELIFALEQEEMLSDVGKVDLDDKFNLRISYLGRFEILLGDREDLKYKFAMVREVIKELGEGTAGSIDISDPNTAYVKLSEEM